MLAQLPAKLIKLFRWNVEQNSHSAGMVPGITWKEWPRNERNRINDAQMKHQHLPTLNLGIVNPSIPSSSTTTTTTTIDDAHPPPPPHHHRLIATITSSSPSPLATTHSHCPLSGGGGMLAGWGREEVGWRDSLWWWQQQLLLLCSHLSLSSLIICPVSYGCHIANAMWPPASDMKKKIGGCWEDWCTWEQGNVQHMNWTGTWTTPKQLTHTHTHTHTL